MLQCNNSQEIHLTFKQNILALLHFFLSAISGSKFCIIKLSNANSSIHFSQYVTFVDLLLADHGV